MLICKMAFNRKRYAVSQSFQQVPNFDLQDGIRLFPFLRYAVSQSFQQVPNFDLQDGILGSEVGIEELIEKLKEFYWNFGRWGTPHSENTACISDS
jgi:hypothetical protein